MKQKITATVLFDSQYIEPAFVTAYELIQQIDNEDDFIFVYLSHNEQQESDDIELINNFIHKFKHLKNINLTIVKNQLHNYSHAHFNSSILYKALMPLVLKNEPFLINFDAGILLGNEFKNFWKKTKTFIAESRERWIIGAHCHDPDKLLGEDLIQIKHNILYPAGCILLFNTNRYLESNWHNTFFSNYSKYINILKYAEQELICISSSDGEIIELSGTHERYTPYLDLNFFYSKSTIIPLESAYECLFFKFVGSIKPWKYWVLDPNKRIYLKRLNELEKYFPMAGIEAIEKHRNSISHQNWADEYLKAYDYYLKNNTKLDLL